MSSAVTWLSLACLAKVRVDAWLASPGVIVIVTATISSAAEGRL